MLHRQWQKSHQNIFNGNFCREIKIANLFWGLWKATRKKKLINFQTFTVHRKAPLRRKSFSRKKTNCLIIVCDFICALTSSYFVYQDERVGGRIGVLNAAQTKRRKNSEKNLPLSLAIIHFLFSLEFVQQVFSTAWHSERSRRKHAECCTLYTGE